MAGLLEDQVADKLGEFACPYGCGATHSYAGWPAHTLVCPNTPMECPFWHTADKCNSSICNFSGSLAELSRHAKAHCDLVYFADCMETTMNIGTFMQAVSDASSLPEDHPYHDDIVHNRIHNQRAHSLTPIPANMRVPHINGDPQTWQLSEVYGMIYGYKMYIGGLLITFFTTVKNGDSVSLHYIAWSLTAETLTFDIVMSNEKKRRVNNSTVIESMLKVSPRMVSHSDSHSHSWPPVSAAAQVDHSGRAKPIKADYSPDVERIDCAQHVSDSFLHARCGTFQIKVFATVPG